MADLELEYFYGYRMYGGYNQGFAVQYHITVDCDQRCKHCYAFGSNSYISQVENELQLEEKLSIIDQINYIAKRYDTVATLAVTGGDPLLSPHLFQFLEYARRFQSRINIVMMGNSYHIDSNTAEDLKHYGVNIYQISIDGLRTTHDYLRKPGSFEDAFRAFKCLKTAGVETAVMFTLSKKNSADLIPLMKSLNNMPYIDYFGFDRLVPIGSARDNFDESELFTAEEYRDFLLGVFYYEATEVPRIISDKNDKLWALLLRNLSLVNPTDETSTKSFNERRAFDLPEITVLADGTLQAYRKLDIAYGKFPQQDLMGIVRHNSLFKKVFDLSKYRGCNTCELLNYCGGCVAMKHAVNDDIYSEDPYCWRYNNA